MPADQEQWSEGHVDRARRRPRGGRGSGTGGRQSLWWVPGAITILTIGAVIAVTLWQLHANLLFTNTTTTGGDTGAHIAMPKYLETPLEPRTHHRVGPGLVRRLPPLHLLLHHPRSLHRHRRLDHPLRHRLQARHDPRLGHPAHLRLGLWSVLPAAPADPHDHGRGHPAVPLRLHVHHLRREPVLDPGRRVRLLVQSVPGHPVHRPLRLCGARGAPPGLGCGRCWPCVSCPTSSAACTRSVGRPSSRWSSCCRTPGASATTASCASAGAAPIVPNIPWWRTLWWAASTVLIGLLLTGVWLGPFGLEHAYSISMGYTNVEGWALYFREADTWALVLAGLGAITAVLVRSRFGICITLLGIASGVATAIDPQGSLYNVRLLPLWFISVYLMAAWAFGTGCIAVAMWWRRLRAAPLGTGHRPAARLRGVTAEVPDGEVPAVLAAEESAPDRLEPRRRPRRRPARAVHRSPDAAPSTRAALEAGRHQRGHPGLARRVARRRAAVRPLDDPERPRGAHRPERGVELVAVQLHRLRGSDLVPRVPLHHADDGVRGQEVRLWAAHVGVQLEREPLRDARGPHAPALLDQRVHRFHGGAALRVVGHDAVPLPQPGRAVGRTLGARGRPALRTPRRHRWASSTSSSSA